MELEDFMVTDGAPEFHGRKWSWLDILVRVRAGGISWAQMELRDFMVADGAWGFNGHTGTC